VVKYVLVETLNITKMYTQELGLTEKLAIVEDFFQISTRTLEGHYTLIPDNNAEIIIPIKENLTFKCIGSVRPLTFLAGKSYFLMPRRRGAVIPLSFRSNCLIIKVNPIYAKKLSDQLNEISYGVFDLGMDKDCLERLCKGFDLMDKYELSDRLEDLLDVSSDLFEYNMTIVDAIDQIRESNGTVSVKEIYTKLRVSKSKLEQHFNREIGLTPKEFCKIQKINYFINSYMENGDISLTELTYHCGYYDQSHLIKDFRYFLDRSPKEYFS
jgi:AraC-like DNA-binding protein